MRQKGRITVINFEDSLIISIKMLRNKYVIVPLLFTALVWVYGLFFLMEKVFESFRTLIEMGIAGMLFFWFIPGFAIFSTLYWIFFGKEKLIVTEQYVQTIKPIHLYKRKRVYKMEDVVDIRVDREVFKVKRGEVWEDDFRTVLKFDTPYKRVTCGRGLTSDEAEFILLELAKTDFLDEDKFKPVSIT